MVTILKSMVSRRFATAIQLSAEIMQQRGYEDAVKKLNSLQTNAQVLEQIRRSRGRLVHNNLPEMMGFTERAGVKMEDLDNLSIIHISGTKGKGSTCAFCESMLRHKGFKTGFYSSPHLMEVRERIRINGKPLSKEKFSKYFFDCWDNLLNNGDEEGKSSMPAYFRFLTLMSFHVFLQEKVDVVILEVGIGGAYDSTNIIRKPVVCGVTSLGMDHVSTLGGTLENIAWQKAGIFKSGVPAFSVPQPENAMTVVANRAKELEAPLCVVPSLEQYPGKLPDLGLEGQHQFLNASLALQLCQTWLQRTQKIDKTLEGEEKQTSATESTSNGQFADEPAAKKAKVEVPLAKTFEVSEALRSGLKNTKWCGRNQVIVRPRVSFYLDGAHTPKSMEACVKWFKKRADEEKQNESGSVTRVLLFNLTGDRDPNSLLKPIMECNIDHAIFCPNTVNLNLKNSDTDSDLTNFTVTRDSQLRWCVENQRVWMALRGAGFQAHANPSQDSTEDDHVIKNGHDDGPYSTIFPCVSQAIRWLVGGRDPCIPAFSPGGLPLPDFISQASRLQVLIGGSLHLVGTAMKVLGPEIVGDV
ncbi:folylpolyglutamate synthase, mitochondrial-like isoform X2 [Oculina patagonica]